jgi:hypothetical protein
MSTQLTDIGGVPLRDQIKQPLYDSFDITDQSVVSAERQFFAATQGKPLSMSNLRVNGQLERNKSFRIMGIQMEASSSDPAKTELLSLYSIYSHVQLWVAEKQYWESPLRMITGKIEHRVSVNATDASDAYVQLGATNASPVMYHQNQSIVLEPQMNFYMIWKVEGANAAQITKMTPSAAHPVRFTAQLKGLMRRPVQ